MKTKSSLNERALAIRWIIFGQLMDRNNAKMDFEANRRNFNQHLLKEWGASAQAKPDWIEYLVVQYLRWAGFAQAFLPELGKFNKLPNAVQVGLQLGFVQLIWMPSLKQFVVVNETVEAVKQLGHGNLAGLVNAVLKNVISKKDYFLAQQKLMLSKATNPELLRYFFYSDQFGELLKKNKALPASTKWAELLGAMQIRDGLGVCFIRSNNSPMVQLATSLNKKAQIKEASTIAGMDSAVEDDTFIYQDFQKQLGVGSYWLKNTKDLEKSSLIKEGQFFVQDLGSQCVINQIAQTLKNNLLPTKPACWVDVCAAPGGKSLKMAMATRQWELPFNEFFLCEPNDERFQKLLQNVQQFSLSELVGAAKIHMLKEAAQQSNFLAIKSEKVFFIDAPCSASGVVAKYPWLKNEAASRNAELAKLQWGILKAVFAQAKSGDWIFYCVCSIFANEGQGHLELINREFSHKIEAVNWQIIPLAEFPNSVLQIQQTTINQHQSFFISPSLQNHGYQFFGVRIK